MTLAALCSGGLLLSAGSAQAQRVGHDNQVPTTPDFPTNDPMIRAIWSEGMENSQVVPLAQYLADVIGPRLTGSPEHVESIRWALSLLDSWDVEAMAEPYGTWRSWQRGPSHVDLVAPRVRSLEGTMLAWSVGTGGVVEGDAVLLPRVQGTAQFSEWLPNARGKFVLLTQSEASCRPASSWEAYGPEGAAERFNALRTAATDEWTARVTAIGMNRQAIVDALEEAGAIGFLTNYWTGGWGTDRVFPLPYAFGAMNHRAAAFNLSCEDYGLVYRLAENGQGPRLRAVAESKDLGEQPAFNVVGILRGTELPEEYVLLSAHLDSWDGSSGMTDNGTGSVVMLEAMRILKKLYPNPKRTLVVGLWGGEEQGLVGSRAFAADHPDVVKGLQLAINHDGGTGRVNSVSMKGLTEAGEFFANWFSRLPTMLVQDIRLTVPGTPGGAASDDASFLCSGAPSFGLGTTSYDYGTATWHTNRDTFDKLAPDDLKQVATLTAYLAYLASEDERIPRDRPADLGTDPKTGAPIEWPACENGARRTQDRFR